MNKIKNNIPVLILAGGFGTRLSNVLNGKPKPLAEISGTPFILLLLLKLINEGFSEFIFSLHYEASKIIEVIENNPYLKSYSKKYIIEPQPLGTGGAILYSLNESKLNGDFLVVNADSIIEKGYYLFIESTSPTLGLIKVDNCERFGLVSFDEKNYIIEFMEKTGEKKEGYINAGIYRLNKNDFDDFQIGNSFSLESDVFPKLITKNKLKGITIRSNFIDIGIPEDYFYYNNLIKKQNGK